MIAALFVETDGCYFNLPGVDPWDEPRDARRYDGPWPVVAHPPCQRWGKLWAGQPLFIKQTGIRKIKGDDGGCFEAALNAARKFSGVIEHPWQSHAWPHFGLTTPPRSGGWIKADEFGGWTCCVEQGRYGHYARKPTMLLVYGVDELPELEWGESEMRLDPVVVARMGLKRAKRLGEVGARGGGQNSTPRIHTPIPFRDLLISIAQNNSQTLLPQKSKSSISEPYPKQNHRKGVKMNISLTIDCETTEEYFDTLQKLLAGTAISTTAPAAEKNTDNVVALSGKRKPKAVDKTVEPEAKTEEPAQAEVDKLAENLEPEGDEDFSETTAEPEKEEPKVKLTQDNVRALAIRFVNACIPGDAAKDVSLQGKRKEEFAALLKVFGVGKFTEIAAEQWPAVVEYVTKQRADRKLPADEVREADAAK